MSVIKKEKLEEIYKKAKQPVEAGKTAMGKIVEIRYGKAKEFFDHPITDPDLQMIQYIVKTPDDYKIKITGKLSLHPMSKLRRLTDTLGHKPAYGDEIPLIFDGKFWRPKI
ncbi:MAG: hypothetical protein QMD13_09420 [Candidatus Bathyarchaeia archaeon]|nr:hypothetical protein [Candidatus Bathyarchaeia archaeon]